MTVIIYAAACLAFCASFALLHIVPHARQEIGRLWMAVSELGAPGLTDDMREERVRQAALRALTGTGQLFLRIAGMVCATLAPVWLADAAGLVPADAVAGFALRLDVAIATTVCAILLVAAYRHRSRTRS
jgi:hypothetical protein